ncbi:putative quinol monooxygenase [Streptacidiphilus jiangxiensis]|uniref:Quinol monooxygenase YgiN n=1 Tax=Streptacidiphilus jiangxiensis TaxID=235985 RepID=A0A1H7JNH9_STRJI|nr:putative quinol monooxygenase [Streptacidiphilus jiangxiensis]SEK76151.1 Quinol monooxygenase YgiN [Streptacidiphilus jiangxiensis]
MSKRVSVVAVLKAKPGREQEMRAQARSMQEASSAEPGCLSYRNYVDPDDPRSWVVVEEWEDRAALDAHLASPHLARSLELSATLLAEPPSMRILTETA